MSDAVLKKDADYVFYELTRSICPKCRKVIDAKIVLRDNKVFMRKRCADCGPFEALVYSDAEAYTSFGKFNKPGTIPLAYGTEIRRGCPHDCGLCPDHQQHTCLGIIEVNSVCNMDCPLCFSDASPGFTLTLEEVEQMLDDFVRTEGKPEVVQFSGGEPTIHPQIIEFSGGQAAEYQFRHDWVRLQLVGSLRPLDRRGRGAVSPAPLVRAIRAAAPRLVVELSVSALNGCRKRNVSTPARAACPLLTSLAESRARLCPPDR
jgi:uncharacterized radical SAM superfamily Fe-S cluster-containing enzyme